MNDLLNSLKSAALSVGEMLTPVLRESKFKETGVITPEEFVAAGNHLVHHCPTWVWASASDPSRTRDYLPKERQFLVTRHVPCHQRCDQMDYDIAMEKLISEGGGQEGDEWVDTHHFSPEDDLAGQKARPLDSSGTSRGATAAALSPTQQHQEEKEQSDSDNEDDDAAPAADMDALMAGSGGGLEEEADPNRYIKPREQSRQNADESGEAEIEQTRTYDLHITYDKYYQVPRFWLLGYDEQGRPLSVTQMKEDFSQEHADRTITLEPHPHVAGVTLATIHPCRHAAVMKRLIEQFSENGKELSVLDYLFVFLKFVQAVIPTVEYDYTRSIQF